MKRLFIALYFDENVTVQIAKTLARRGYDVLTALDAEVLGESDERQFEFAVSQARAIVTHDRDDFLRLHLHYLAEGRKHFGIIISPQRQSPSEITTRIITLLDRVTADEMENQLRYV